MRLILLLTLTGYLIPFLAILGLRLGLSSDNTKKFWLQLAKEAGYILVAGATVGALYLLVNLAFSRAGNLSQIGSVALVALLVILPPLVAGNIVGFACRSKRHRFEGRVASGLRELKRCPSCGVDLSDWAG